MNNSNLVKLSLFGGNYHLGADRHTMVKIFPFFTFVLILVMHKNTCLSFINNLNAVFVKCYNVMNVSLLGPYYQLDEPRGHGAGQIIYNLKVALNYDFNFTVSLIMSILCRTTDTILRRICGLLESRPSRWLLEQLRIINIHQ